MFEGDYLSNSISPYSPSKRAPIVSLRVSPTNGSTGVPTDVTLTWSIEYGVSASMAPFGAIAPTSGSRIVNGVLITTTWTLQVIALNGAVVNASATYTAS